MVDRDGDENKKILDSVDTKTLFDKTESAIIEWNIDNIVQEAREGKFKRYTVDRAPLRTKYFFGEGYTYGGQLQERGAGNEKLYPRGEVDPIPNWIQELVIKPVEESGLVRSGWINSAVINDYLPGGCIVSHIDPPQLFSRPIITVSFFSDSHLSFGCKFSFKPIRVSRPLAQVAVRRGEVLSMYGFSANKVTHCIRPQDIQERRAVIILRHVPDTAPRMTDQDMEHFLKMEQSKRREKSVSPSRSNVQIYDHRKFLKVRNYQHRFRSRSRSRDRVKSIYHERDRNRRKFRSRSPRRLRSPEGDRNRRRSRSRSPRRLRRSPDRDRYGRHRSRSLDIHRYRRSYSSRSRSSSPDRPGGSKCSVKMDKNYRGITNMSSRTVDKILKKRNIYNEDSQSRSRSRSNSKEKIKNKMNKKVPINKSVQDIILKNILGSYEDDVDNNDGSSTDESVQDKDEGIIMTRLQKLKTQMSDKVSQDNESKDDQNNKSKRGLEKEVEDLKQELKELKEHLKEKESQTSTSESESSEDDKPMSVLDVFKTTILQKSKKSTYFYNKNKQKKSKLIETKTRKILKQRFEMLKKKK